MDHIPLSRENLFYSVKLMLKRLKAIDTIIDVSLAEFLSWQIVQDDSIAFIRDNYAPLAYVDGSLAFRDASLENLYDVKANLTYVDETFLRESSLGDKLIWDASSLLDASISIIDLTDTSISTPEDKQVLIFDTSMNKFKLIDTADAALLYAKLTYVDSSLAVRDASLEVLFTKDLNIDTSLNDLYEEKVSRSGDSMYGELDMSTNSISNISALLLERDPIEITRQEGELHWDVVTRTMEIETGLDNVKIQTGLETLRVGYNSTGETIFKGTPVIADTSTYDGYILFLKAQANNIFIRNLLGIATHDIQNNSIGFVSKVGIVNGLDTTMWNSGDLLYVSGDVEGELTNIKPKPSQYPVSIARVEIVDASAGAIALNQLTLDQNAGRIFAGIVKLGALTDNGDHTATVEKSLVNLFDEPDFDGDINTFVLEASTFTIPPDITSYIVGDYNAGNPIYKLITNIELVNESTIIPIYTLFRDASSIYNLHWDAAGLGLPNKLHLRFVATNRFARESGLGLSEDTGRVIVSSEGKLWHGAVRTTLNALRSDTNSTFLWYKSGAIWTNTDVSTYNNTQYQGENDLIELNNNFYGVNWIYRSIGDTIGGNSIRILLGDEEYNKLIEAQNSQPPNDAPPIITSNSILIGRIIVKKNDTTASKIDSAFEYQFISGVAIPNHNDTTEIQGGTVGEYYHWTFADYSDRVLKSYVDSSLAARDASLEILFTKDLNIDTSLNEIWEYVDNQPDSSIDYATYEPRISDTSIYYNAAGLVTKRITTNDLGTKTIEYVYNSNEDVSVMYTNNYGKWITETTYERDASNNIIAVHVR